MCHTGTPVQIQFSVQCKRTPKETSLTRVNKPKHVKQWRFYAYACVTVKSKTNRSCWILPVLFNLLNSLVFQMVICSHRRNDIVTITWNGKKGLVISRFLKLFVDNTFYHPWKWFQPITGQDTVVIFHEIATVSWFQMKSKTVWFLSWKSDTKIKFPSVKPLNYFKENQKGENDATDAFITKFPPKRLKECSPQSARNSSARAFTHEWSCSIREIFVFKNNFWSGLINM